MGIHWENTYSRIDKVQEGVFVEAFFDINTLRTFFFGRILTLSSVFILYFLSKEDLLLVIHIVYFHFPDLYSNVFMVQ